MPAVARTSSTLATLAVLHTNLERVHKLITSDISSLEVRALSTTASFFANHAIIRRMRAETIASGRWLDTQAIIHISVDEKEWDGFFFIGNLNKVQALMILQGINSFIRRA